MDELTGFEERYLRRRRHGQAPHGRSDQPITSIQSEVSKFRVEFDETYSVDLKKQRLENFEKDVEFLKLMESIAAPILFTLLGFAVRVYRLGINDTVVWDEAHFGKFGSYYLRHEFYHDVHPPLGKMLIGFSGYLAGYNGSWDFTAGKSYPTSVDYVYMRLFQALFSTLCVPVAYLTCKEIGFGILPTWLFTLMVALEQSYVTLARFILLDSMLLFFTAITMYFFVKFHNQRDKPLTIEWFRSLIFLGISLGCVNSIKMVGLFVTALVGVYTIVDLWNLLGDTLITKKKYLLHWLSRIVALILLPLSIYLICFKIHFSLLWHSGNDDSVMDSLFQYHLVGSRVGLGPRDVAIGRSNITLKNQAIGAGLLHSHVQIFPKGSMFQQITGYSHRDDNNNWILEYEDNTFLYEYSTHGASFLEDGMTVRFIHAATSKNLHAENIEAPVSTEYFEVSAFGDHLTAGAADSWKIEIVDQIGSEHRSRIHPLTTSFTIINKKHDCYLATSGKLLPDWGFSQQEVVCIPYKDLSDKNINIIKWNVESHINDDLTSMNTKFEVPRPSFWQNFKSLNIAMMNTNNALVLDKEKSDELVSSFWQWPTLHTGIRLCNWKDDLYKYYLLGSPATTWTSLMALVVFFLSLGVLILRWQRQIANFPDTVEGRKNWNLFKIGGMYPFLGWILHYLPFAIMGRVTYVHHYLPALYFAMMVYTYVFEELMARIKNKNNKFKTLIYIFGYMINFTIVAGTFWYFRYISFGMFGPSDKYKYLNWLDSWKIVDKKEYQ